MSWYIVLFAIWVYPLIGYFFFHLSKEVPGIGKTVVIILGVMTGMVLGAIWIDISFTVSTIDWIIITIPFLYTCVLLWRTLFFKKRIWRILGIVLMVIVFGVGYLSGSIGAIGVGFVTSSMESETIIEYDDGIRYKEYTIGNAISDFRGKRVQITKRIQWLPFLEREVCQKSYYGLVVYIEPLEVNYNPEIREFRLSASRVTPDSTYTWQDSFRIE